MHTNGRFEAAKGFSALVTRISKVLLFFPPPAVCPAPRGMPLLFINIIIIGNGGGSGMLRGRKLPILPSKPKPSRTESTIDSSFVNPFRERKREKERSGVGE